MYDARLTVTDATGRTGVATAVVTVGNTRPVVEIETPPNGAFFEFGDSVRVKVNVTDPEDGTIDCTKVEIDYVLGHDSHGHPLSSATGCDVVLPTVRGRGPRRLRRHLRRHQRQLHRRGRQRRPRAVR